MTTGLIQQKTQPFNIEAEISVLGSMLLDNEAINLVTEILRTDNFYKTSHQHIFDTIVNIYNKNIINFNYQSYNLLIINDPLKKISDFKNLSLKIKNYKNKYFVFINMNVNKKKIVLKLEEILFLFETKIKSLNLILYIF